MWGKFWDSKSPEVMVIAEYSRTEISTPFNIHWTTSGDYFECYEPVQTITINGAKVLIIQPNDTAAA